MLSVYVVVAFVGGVVLGTSYFLLLWKTVAWLAKAEHPVLLAAASFVSRASVVMVGFYLLGGGRWDRLVAALAGFLLARAIILRYPGWTNETCANLSAGDSSHN
jgi:F1F0 ATPase subunit 2